MDLEQNTNVQNSTEEQIEKMTPKQDGGVGPLIGTIIIIALLVLGGLYYWGSIINEQKDTEAPTENVPAGQDEDVSSIEAELDAEFGDVDAELDKIDAEFEAESEA